MHLHAQWIYCIIMLATHTCTISWRQGLRAETGAVGFLQHLKFDVDADMERTLYYLKMHDKGYWLMIQSPLNDCRRPHVDAVENRMRQLQRVVLARKVELDSAQTRTRCTKHRTGPSASRRPDARRSSVIYALCSSRGSPKVPPCCPTASTVCLTKNIINIKLGYFEY